MMGNNMQHIESRAEAQPALATATAPGSKKISFGVDTFCDVKNWGIESLLESPDLSDLQTMQKEYEAAENLLFGETLPGQESGLAEPQEREGSVNLFESGSGAGLDSLESVPINKYLTSIFDLTKDSRYGHKTGKSQMLKKYNTYADRNADIFLPFESEDLFFKNGPDLDCITFDNIRLSEGGYEQGRSGGGMQLKGAAEEQETEQDDARTMHYHDITNTSSTNSSAQGGGYQGIRKAKTDIHNYETNRKRQDQLLNIYRSFNTPTPDMKGEFQDSLFGFSLNAQNAFGSDALTGTATFGDKTKSPLFHPLSFGSPDPMADTIADTLIGSLDHDKEATAESLRPSESCKNHWTIDPLTAHAPAHQLKEEMNAAEYNLYKNLMNYLDTQDTKEAPGGLVSSISGDPSFDPSGKDDLIDLQHTVLYEASEPTNLDAFHDNGFMDADSTNTRLGDKATSKYFDATKGAEVAPTLPGPLGSMGYRKSELLASEYFPLKGSPEVKHPYLGTGRDRYGAAVVDPRDSAADPTNSKSKASSILKNCIVSLIQNGEDDITLYESLVNAISEHHRLKNTPTPKYAKPGMNDKAATNLKSVDASGCPFGSGIKRTNYAVPSGGMYRNAEETDMSTRTYVHAGDMRMRLPKSDPMDRYLPLNEDRTSRKESLSKCAGGRMDYFKSGVATEVPTMDPASGSKQPVVNVLYEEYYSKFLPKRESCSNKIGAQENKGYDQFAYGRKKSDTERRGATFGRKKDCNIDDMLFSNIRNKKDLGYPSGLVDVNKKTEETSLYSQDRFVNGQFVPRKRSGGVANQLNFNVGARGIAEVRSRNKNLGSFYSPDVNRMSAMHNLHGHKGAAEGLAGIGEIRNHIPGTFDKVDAYRDSKMRSRTPGYVSKPWMNESLQKGMMTYHGREGAMNPTSSMNRGLYRSDLVKGQTFSKYKSVDCDNVRYTPEQLKSLITKEDERNMDLLLQSLYDDRILPLEFNLNGRLEEMKILSFLKNNWMVAYGLFPEKYSIKKTKDLSDNLIFFRNRKVEDDYFVYLNNLEDKYDKEMWVQFEKYLKTIAESEDPSVYEFAGGRYGMAKELKRRNLPFFEGLYLGHICHIIHLSTNKKLIAYEQKLLKPISKCHKFMNAKLGILNTNESDSNTYIASIEELRFYMNELLKYYRGGFNISTLKKKLKTRFNKQISESIFHCIKLIDVLQLKELSDICIIDKEMKYVRSAKKQ